MNVLLFLLTNNQSDTRFQDFPGTVVTIAGVRSASDRPPGDQGKVQCCAGLLAACLSFVDTHAAEILGTLSCPQSAATHYYSLLRQTSEP